MAQWASPDGRPPRKAPGDLLLTMSGLGGEYFGTSGRCLDVAAGAELEREKKGQKKVAQKHKQVTHLSSRSSRGALEVRLGGFLPTVGGFKAGILRPLQARLDGVGGVGGLENKRGKQKKVSTNS